MAFLHVVQEEPRGLWASIPTGVKVGGAIGILALGTWALARRR